jgi:hypothetical protein
VGYKVLAREEEELFEALFVWRTVKAVTGRSAGHLG